MAKKAEELGGSLQGVFVDPGSPGDKTAILDRPVGKEMLETLRAGDTLIVNRLDRLGSSMRDVSKTVKALAEREVRIYVLRAVGWGTGPVPHGSAKSSSNCSTCGRRAEKRFAPNGPQNWPSGGRKTAWRMAACRPPRRSW